VRIEPGQLGAQPYVRPLPDMRAGTAVAIGLVVFVLALAGWIIPGLGDAATPASAFRVQTAAGTVEGQPGSQTLPRPCTVATCAYMSPAGTAVDPGVLAPEPRVNVRSGGMPPVMRASALPWSTSTSDSMAAECGWRTGPMGRPARAS